MLEVTGYLKLD